MFLGFGGGDRQAQDIRGKESEMLARFGWRNLEGWTLVQEESMSGRGRDQFGVVTVGPGGRIDLEVCYLDDDEPGGIRRSERMNLHAPVAVAPAEPNIAVPAVGR
jgi:hypothetical protein